MNPCAVLVPIPFDPSSKPPARVLLQREYARFALSEAAKRCGAPTSGWQQDESRRPIPNGEFHWSISHAKRWAAAVIDDGPVGVDIEQIKPRQLTTMDAIANKAEWPIIGERSWPNFFRIWTAKEATLKAHGVGIGYLSECQVVGVATSHAGCTPSGEPRASARAESTLNSELTRGVQSEILRLKFQGAEFQVQQFLHDQHIASVTCSEEVVQWHTIDIGVDHALPS